MHAREVVIGSRATIKSEQTVGNFRKIADGSWGSAKGMALNPADGGPCGFGALWYVRMCATPGIFSAALVSIDLMRACGCGQVRNLT